MQVLETRFTFCHQKGDFNPISQNRKQHNQRFHDNACSCSFALFASVTACSFLCETAAEKKQQKRLETTNTGTLCKIGFVNVGLADGPQHFMDGYH